MKEWDKDQIKELRQRLGLSQYKFAELVGVTRNYVYYLERGERKPIKTLKILMNCLEQKADKKEKGKAHG